MFDTISTTLSQMRSYTTLLSGLLGGFAGLILDGGVTVLISTHDVEFVEYADRCFHMEKGTLREN